MTDQTPAYWVVIYTADDWTDAVSGDRRPLISAPVWAKTKQEASHRIVNARQGRDALNTVGPFTDQTEAESYRRTWARDQGKRTIATLMDETASVIHTNSLRDRTGRTPAQNAALPPVVNLYQAFNIVTGGTSPDDTRGSRNGINSADLVRTFNAFLNQGSALEWSQAPERTHPEIMNALRACASALRDAADRGNSATFPGFAEDRFVGPRVLVHVGDVLKHKDMAGTVTVVSRNAEDRGFMLAGDPECGAPFSWDDYEMPGNEDSPFTLVSCPHLDDSAEPAGAPDLGVSAYPHTEWIVTVHGDDEEGDPGARAGSVLSTPSLEMFMDQLRDAGLTTSIDRGAGGITYASAIAPTGYIRLRRPNPGEIGAARTPAQVEQDAIRRETYPTSEPAPRGGIGEDTAAFLERQNRALEAFRSGITQGIHMNRDKAKGMGPDAKTSAGAVVEFLSDLLKQAEREYDRQMKL